MGGCHCADSLFMKEGQNGNCQRSTLCRVCPGTQLIKENQRVLICFFQERDYIGHMGGEGTKRLFNALLISDICVYLMENRKLRAVKGRNMKSGLTH